MHKTQPETRILKKEEIRAYIQSYWVSEDFDPNDLKSTCISQPSTLFSPTSTFTEKLLEDKFRRHIIKTNLDVEYPASQTDLIPDDNSVTSLPAKEFSIPDQYLELLDLEIFHTRDPLESENHGFVIHLTSSELWERFGQWAGFEKTKKFRHHCRRLWKKTKHAYNLYIESLKNPMELYDIPNVFLSHPNDKLFIADETTKKVAGDVHLDGYKYVSKPWCLKNAIGENFFDLDLNNYLTIETAQVVDRYYKHNLSEPSHRSNQFIKELIEHFGCFTDNNNLPYVTASTASNHSQEHRVCVRELIQGLQPLSDVVNNYLDATYPALYAKMKKLDLGPNVPKSFGAFPTVGINFNSICQFHRDLKDHRNSLCVVCPLGTFEGGHLAFPELKLAVMAKQGQAIAFRSHLLIHGNFPIIIGSRHSVVFYIHDTVIKQNQRFSSLFDDEDLDASEILDNSQPIVDSLNIAGSIKKHDKKMSKYSLPRLAPRNSSKLKNHRRSYIDLEPARGGLPAQYRSKIPSSTHKK